MKNGKERKREKNVLPPEKRKKRRTREEGEMNGKRRWQENHQTLMIVIMMILMKGRWKRMIEFHRERERKKRTRSTSYRVEDPPLTHSSSRLSSLLPVFPFLLSKTQVCRFANVRRIDTMDQNGVTPLSPFFSFSSHFSPSYYSWNQLLSDRIHFTQSNCFHLKLNREEREERKIITKRKMEK